MVEASSNFIPRHFKWLIIKNKDYSQMRTYEGFSSYADLPSIDADAEFVRNQILEMGFRSADIQVLENLDFRGFSTTI